MGEKFISKTLIKKISLPFIWLHPFICLYGLTNPLRSVKRHRVGLVWDYLHYKKAKYHLKNCLTLKYKLGSTFCRAWFRYNNTI
jgi:hypothetical protein